MLSKETETFVVVIKCAPLKRGYYQVELGDAEGEIYELTVHEETVVDYRLVLGKELDQATFERLQNSMGFQKAYSYAIGILARRMYSIKEIRRKLYERETTEDLICQVIDKLMEIKLLDDDVYATTYIESQVEAGRKSKRRIISDLIAKGVSMDIIDDLTDLFDKKSEHALMIKEIEQAYRRYSRQNLNDFDLARKVTQSLGRKGFDFYEVGRQYGFFIEDLKAEADEG